MFSLSGKSKNQIPCFPCAVATLHTLWGRGVYPIPRSGLGGERRVPLPRCGPGGGGTSIPSQDCWRVPLGTSHPGQVPGQDGGGVCTPCTRLDVDTPPPRTGWGTPYPARTGWGTPPRPGLDGVPPPSRTGWGTPSPVGRQSSTASTCYTASSMPLAFTQEDFLVHHINNTNVYFWWNFARFPSFCTCYLN